MKKTISVDIHGQNFIIDEIAYARLNEYLEDIKTHFGSDTNVEEVMNDIEASISEKLQSTITSFKNVVTLEDIEELIRVMGTAKDFDDAIGEESKSETRDTKNETKEEEKEDGKNQMKRKLYRDTENAVIAGVASGLSAYFDIDPVIFRILFVVFTFTGGFAIPLYLVLWIVMPEAKTINQKLEMRGKTPTLGSLEQMTQNKDFKKAQSTLRKILEVPFTVLRAIFGAIQKIWRGIGPVFRVLFGSLLIIGSLVGLGFLGVGTVYALLNLNAPYMFSYIPISEIANTVPFIWILITGFLSIGIPAIFFLIGGIALIRRKSMINFAAGALLVGLWMIAGITCAAVGLRYMPDVYKKVSSYPALQQEGRTLNFQKIESVSVSGQHIKLDLTSGTSTEISLDGRQVDLNRIEIKEDNGRINITETENLKEKEICLNCGMRRVTIKMNSDLLKQIEVKNSGRISIDGNLKNNPKIEATSDATIIWNNFDHQDISMTVSDQAKAFIYGKASTLSIALDNAAINAPTLTSESIAITSKGTSLAVLGTTAKLTIEASKESRILYSGKPVITGKIENDQILDYRSITENEYEKIKESKNSSEATSATGIIIPKTDDGEYIFEQTPEDESAAKDIAITNGEEFFFIERKDLSKNTFQSFINALRYGRNDY